MVDDGIMLGGPYAAFKEEKSPFPLTHMPPPPFNNPEEFDLARKRTLQVDQIETCGDSL